MPNKQILVTGASGFVGRNLIDNLISQMDLKIYGLSRTAIQFESNNYEHISIDMSVPDWTHFLPSRLDVVIHLSQSYRYREFPNGAIDMVRINIDSTAELLDWARCNGVKRFLFASTGNVYAPGQKEHTEADICDPINMYGVTKFSAEMLVRQYIDYFDTIILRFFGVYGPGQTKMIIPMMIDAVRNGKNITLADGVGLYLNPIYVADCIKILHRLVMSNDTYKNEIFNIAGGQIVTLSRIVKEIENLIKIKAFTSHIDSPPTYLIGSNNKIVRHMKIKNFVPIGRGLSEILEDGR